MATPAWVEAQKDFASRWWGKSNYCYQFHDTREAMGAAGSRRVFTDARPSDFVVTASGRMFYAEVKSCSNETSFPFSGVRKEQWNACIQQVAAGGGYFFYVRKEPEKIWYTLPGAFMVSLFNAGVKSVKWSEIEIYKGFK